MQRPADPRKVPAEPDPVWLTSRREAGTILAIWSMFFTWTLGFSWLAAYEGTSISVTLGIPNWVLWSVLVPWIVAALISVGYSLGWMVDQDLGETRVEPGEGQADTPTPVGTDGQH